MTQWFLTVLAGPLLVACACAASPAGGDLQSLQGDWVLESLEINGKVVAIDSLKIDGTPVVPRLKVQGKRYTLFMGEKSFAMTCQLDPRHTPSQITLTAFEGADKGKVFLGIYKFDADRFVICRALGSTQPRPKDFATTPDSGLIKGVWKRAKP
jgi:uncharacterized protein (TIGR03067 family)